MLLMWNASRFAILLLWNTSRFAILLSWYASWFSIHYRWGIRHCSWYLTRSKHSKLVDRRLNHSWNHSWSCHCWGNSAHHHWSLHHGDRTLLHHGLSSHDRHHWSILLWLRHHRVHIAAIRHLHLWLCNCAILTKHCSLTRYSLLLLLLLSK